MGDVNYEYRCLDCSHVFINDNQQLTCEKCGSTKLNKHVKMSLHATINISSSISFKGTSNKKTDSKKHPIFEFEHKETKNYLGEPVSIDLRRDREKDTYYKTVTDMNSGEMKVVRNKKLSDHKNLKSDKSSVK